MVDEDALVDLKALGVFLRSRRGGMSRREASERTELGQSYIKKLEDGGGASVSLGTVLKLARGYNISLLELLDAATELDKAAVEEWALANTSVRQRVREESGDHVVIQARLPEDVEKGMRSAVLVLGEVREKLDALREVNDGMTDLSRVVGRLHSVVTMAASISASMEKQWASVELPRANDRKELGELVGQECAVQGDDGLPR